MQRRPATAVVVFTLSLFTLLQGAYGADWPDFRYDSARSGVSPDQLQSPLNLPWVHASRHAPRPAWPEPGRELNRIEFDYVYHVAAADGLVYFGSSADHQVHAIDLATGQERWSFFTEGPVRFAPCVSEGRVFVASDDGCLYCLSADKGELVWKFRGGPGPEKLAGVEQIISRWPLRTGAAVRDGVVYITAGMWPAEGIFVYALRAEDGQVIWCNDTSGEQYLPQPHPPSMSMTGVTPQGPIVVYQDQIIVPTGRNVPAVFDRRSGKLLYYHSRPNSWGNRWGGAWALAYGKHFLNWRAHIGPDIDVREGESEPWPQDGIAIFERASGKIKRELVGKLRAAVRGDTLFASGSGQISAYGFSALIGGAKPDKCVTWQTPHERAYSLILAGETVLVGGKGTVTALRAADGKPLWKGQVDGQARGLAAADGSVLVSTTTGKIACFGPTKQDAPATIAPDPVGPPDNALAGAVADAAADILDQTGVTHGYCLVVGDSDGRLAFELAAQSNLNVAMLEPDPTRAQALRQSLEAAGVYGVRVTVHVGTMQQMPYAEYLANLVVLAGADAAALSQQSAGELYRVLRPGGGTAYIATRGPKGPLPAAAIRRSLALAQVPADEITGSDSAVNVVRGPLSGVGSWTHQYANAARTGCSEDSVVRTPLKLLWFGGHGPSMMVSRHWRGPAPLSKDGRLFAIGQHSIQALDAYNGHELWYRELKSAGRFPISGKGGNAALDDTGLYVSTGRTCVRLDLDSGETLREYEMPPPPVGMADEDAEKLGFSYVGLVSNVLLGTMGDPKQGKFLFALDKHTGHLLWRYDATRSVHHDAVAAAHGVVYLIDKPTAEQYARLKRRGEKMSAATRLVAIDAATGEMLWWTDRGLNGRNELRLGGDVLIATGGKRMTAYRADTGRMLSWRGASMRGFPVIVGDVIYGEPRAYDLRSGRAITRKHPLTGEDVPWTFSRSYGCGAVSAGSEMLMFRSSTLGFNDLAQDSGTHNYGAVRAGCYVNAIIAGGLLLMPPADAGCTCSYSYQTTVALAPTTKNEEWSVFSAVGLGKGQRVRHAILNLGAPGDRRDARRKLWLSMPRKAGLKVPVKITHDKPGEMAHRINSDLHPIAGTDTPWVYASELTGPMTLTVALGTDETRSYTIRLHFCELDAVEPGERVFDVKVQGRVAIAGLDVAKQAGAQRTALVKTLTGVEADAELSVELVPSAGASAQHGPIISGLEVHEQ